MEEFSKKKILLADDDASMRRLLEVILKKADFEVFSAEDGLQAMKMAFEDDFDAVVADAIMPHLTGYDLCRMLKKRDGKQHTPVIILSGLDNNSTEADKCIADAYLTKSPKIKDDLLEKLNEIL